MKTSEVDITKLRALDVETPKTVAGRVYPPIVGSMAELLPDGTIRGELLTDANIVEALFKAYVDAGFTIVLANGAFDMTSLAAKNPRLMPVIFRLYREKRILDVLVVHTLDAIFGGHLGTDPRDGMPLRNPATGKVTTRYALATVLDLLTGRKDAKEEAEYRMSYALLASTPRHRWPTPARDYPVHDTRNTLESALLQLRGWQRGRLEPDESGPARNFSNAFFQSEVAFCLSLGAAWSLRTDAMKVEALAERVEILHQKAVERFTKFGWRRPAIDPETGKADPRVGKEDTIAVKRSVAAAYGATGKCKRCGGSGKVRLYEDVECRGLKVRGRYQGCTGAALGMPVCQVCSGTRFIKKLGNEKTCKAVDDGCDGTGLDLSTAPLLPRTDKDGIRADRDTLMESGDDELAVYGEDEFEKTRTTFISYLRSGAVAPLKLKPNVLVASGRISYEGSPFHQLSRNGGVREVIVARPGRVLGSTDYSAGELCSLGQVCYWVIGESRMRDAINASKDPGILHSELAASVLCIPIEEFMVRLKAKDKQCVDFRQASKPINFGTPGGMGAAKLVWTSRKKNAGFTLSEYGPSLDDKGRRGYAGIRFCILVGGRQRCGVEKITEWKKRPTYPVCKACVEIVEHQLRVAYFERFPEINEYFKKVSSWIDQYGRVPCMAWNEEKGIVEILRWRGVSGENSFPAGCNNGFQALLADVMKLAYVTMTREGYLGVKEDGSPSPLAGCRFPVVMHDEPISELFEQTAHLSGPRIGEIMVESGRKLAPDVWWVAETAISRYLAKGMEPVYVDEIVDGKVKKKLVLWEPKN